VCGNSCSGTPVLELLFWNSCSGTPVLELLFWNSCSGTPVLEQHSVNSFLFEKIFF
jgi:hypothetical protein